MKRFEVHLIGEEKWKEVLADSITITETEPRAYRPLHTGCNKPHRVMSFP